MMAIILFATAIFVALVVLVVIYVALCKVNEVKAKTCGKCDFYDSSLQHCWMRDIACGTEDDGCVTYKEREDERES